MDFSRLGKRLIQHTMIEISFFPAARAAGIKTEASEGEPFIFMVY